MIIYTTRRNHINLIFSWNQLWRATISLLGFIKGQCFLVCTLYTFLCLTCSCSGQFFLDTNVYMRSIWGCWFWILEANYRFSIGWNIVAVVGSFMQLLQVSTTREFGCLRKLEPDATCALRLYEALTGQIENICRLFF